MIGGAVSATTPNEAFFLMEMGAAECNIDSGGCYFILQLKGTSDIVPWKLKEKGIGGGGGVGGGERERMRKKVSGIHNANLEIDC